MDDIKVYSSIAEADKETELYTRHNIIESEELAERIKLRDHINVLVLSLSTFRFDKDKGAYYLNSTKYFFRDEENIKDYIDRDKPDGTYYYQMDPTPDILSQKLMKNGDVLDYIIVLATQDTKQFRDENNPIPVRFSVDVPDIAANSVSDTAAGLVSDSSIEKNKNFIVNKLTPFDYFSCMANKYWIYQNDNSQDEQVICVDLIKREEQGKILFDDYDEKTAIAEAVNTIRSLRDNCGKNVYLYSDDHGGLRAIQKSSSAIVSLIDGEEKDGCRITHVDNYVVVYNGDISRVTIDKKASSIYDFVAGIKEFTNYGRIDSLNKYILNHNDISDNIKKLISILKQIVDGISLCDVDNFETALKDLKKYFANSASDDVSLADDKYIGLFKSTIETDYKPILDNLGKNGDPLDNVQDAIAKIEWCYKRGFNQQVLVLIEVLISRLLITENVFLIKDDEHLGTDEKGIDNPSIFYNEISGCLLHSIGDDIKLKKVGNKRINQVIEEYLNTCQNENFALDKDLILWSYPPADKKKIKEKNKKEELKLELEFHLMGKGAYHFFRMHQIMKLMRNKSSHILNDDRSNLNSKKNLELFKRIVNEYKEDLVKYYELSEFMEYIDADKIEYINFNVAFKLYMILMKRMFEIDPGTGARDKKNTGWKMFVDIHEDVREDNK